MTPEFAQTAWSRLLLGSLARCGIRHAVVSPGSRSTPFVTALLEEKSIELHVAIDERSAGFIGIGLARGTSRPTLLVCTSGTAAANYLPAIVEANLAGVPLVVLTADRPLEVQHSSAPQTMDQNRLYGTHVRRFVDLGEGPMTVRALRGFRRLVLDAVQVASGPHPGPVHINARARQPLEPASPIDGQDRDLDQCVDALLEETCPLAIPSESAPSLGHLEPIAAACASTRRGLVLCGFDARADGLDPESLALFAQATGYPVWLDPSHPLRWRHPPSLAAHVVHCADLLWSLDDFVLDHRPQVIIQVGPRMTSGHMDHWLRNVGAECHVVLSREGWPDPTGRSNYLALGNPSLVLKNLAEAVGAMRGGLLGERPWFLDWRTLDVRAEQLLDDWIGQQSAPSLGELSVVRWVLDACPASTQLVLGNSLPIREAATVCPAGNRELEVFANRGANGIDGILSTAVGIALAGSIPTLVLLGDISFLHDIGSLWAARSVKSPFVVVVVDNRGGRVFEQLPVRDAVAEDKLNVWTTPHQLDLWAAGLLYGIETVRPEGASALAQAVTQGLRRAGPTLIHVVTDPSSARLDADSLRVFLEANLFV
jgi:2-succinyl-5-enolpyruvyl-6-hydroxy-3-cyclohexene-1-carboxylate synthase